MPDCVGTIKSGVAEDARSRLSVQHKSQLFARLDCESATAEQNAQFPLQIVCVVARSALIVYLRSSLVCDNDKINDECVGVL